MLRNKSPLFQNFRFLLQAKYLSDRPRTFQSGRARKSFAARRSPIRRGPQLKARCKTRGECMQFGSCKLNELGVGDENPVGDEFYGRITRLLRPVSAFYCDISTRQRRGVDSFTFCFVRDFIHYNETRFLCSFHEVMRCHV